MSISTDREEHLIASYESRIAAYSDTGYRFEYDVYLMKHFYAHFKFMKLSQFVEAMRFLVRVSS